VALESGTGLVVLVRAMNRQIERIRAYTDDCPLDAGGRTLYWLTGIAPAESLKFLDGAIYSGALTPALQKTYASQAIRAIALHADAGADTILDRLATAERDTDLRKAAVQRLAADRGAHGFTRVRQLLDAESAPDARVMLAEALGQTRQPQTADALLALAKSDQHAGVRRVAAYWYPIRAGVAGLEATIGLINTDPDEDVKARALSGLTTLPAAQTVPRLIELARSHASLRVRRESVNALGRTKDPRAIAYLEELLRK
jgi:HEAT repeat protein